MFNCRPVAWIIIVHTNCSGTARCSSILYLLVYPVYSGSLHSADYLFCINRVRQSEVSGYVDKSGLSTGCNFYVWLGYYNRFGDSRRCAAGLDWDVGFGSIWIYYSWDCSEGFVKNY